MTGLFMRFHAVPGFEYNIIRSAKEFRHRLTCVLRDFPTGIAPGEGDATTYAILYPTERAQSGTWKTFCDSLLTTANPILAWALSALFQIHVRLLVYNDIPWPSMAQLAHQDPVEFDGPLRPPDCTIDIDPNDVVVELDERFQGVTYPTSTDEPLVFILASGRGVLFPTVDNATYSEAPAMDTYDPEHPLACFADLQ